MEMPIIVMKKMKKVNKLVDYLLHIYKPKMDITMQQN